MGKRFYARLPHSKWRSFDSDVKNIHQDPCMISSDFVTYFLLKIEFSRSRTDRDWDIRKRRIVTANKFLRRSDYWQSSELADWIKVSTTSEMDFLCLSENPFSSNNSGSTTASMSSGFSQPQINARIPSISQYFHWHRNETMLVLLLRNMKAEIYCPAWVWWIETFTAVSFCL